MHTTKNNLAEGVRNDMELLLDARLADAIDLFNQTQHAHWNVKGRPSSRSVSCSARLPIMSRNSPTPWRSVPPIGGPFD